MRTSRLTLPAVVVAGLLSACRDPGLAPRLEAPPPMASAMVDAAPVCTTCVFGPQLVTSNGATGGKFEGTFLAAAVGSYEVVAQSDGAAGARVDVRVNGMLVLSSTFATAQEARANVALLDANRIRIATQGPAGSRIRVFVVGGARQIGPSGGTITTPGGDLTLTIPAGALASPTELSITPTLDRTVPSSFQPVTPVGPSWSLEPHGLVFNAAATLSVSYASVSDRVDQSADLGLVHVAADGSTATLLAATDDAVAQRISAPLPGFSRLLLVRTVPLTFQTVTAGDHHACGLDRAGYAYCWGYNATGQLGNGTTANTARPAPVVLDFKYRSISAGTAHTCALTTTNAVKCWGGNLAGQLGDGTTTDRLTPVSPLGNPRLVQLSAATYLTCGIARNNNSYCWGAGGRNGLDYGGLGSPAPQSCGAYYGTPPWPCATQPQQVLGGVAFADIAVGLWYVCARTASDVGYCWGYNSFYTLGDGTFNNAPTPVPIAGGLSLRNVRSGAAHSCGVDVAGAGHCWGARIFNFGQLGNGTFVGSAVPSPVSGNLQFTTVQPSTGNDIYEFTCGLMGGGTAYCWGANQYGNLGAPSTEVCNSGVDFPCSSTPIAVSGGLAFKNISLGAEYACAATPTGEGYCWGRNAFGALGNGSTTDASVPTRIN